MNLLDNFALSHTQITRLHADLTQTVPENQAFSAKVELKLTPRPAQTHGDPVLPVYQVGARLLCRGFKETDQAGDEPMFTVELVLQALYRQFTGEPVGFEQFTANHTSLTRQLYPLIHHQLQPILKQFGLNQVRLPHDLVNTPAEQPDPMHVH
jgi:hypothetical protein